MCRRVSRGVSAKLRERERDLLTYVVKTCRMNEQSDQSECEKSRERNAVTYVRRVSSPSSSMMAAAVELSSDETDESD
jgi:hypothetical protein